MDITFAPRGILQINDARIVYRNFEGVGNPPYNREGDRNFSLVIPEQNLTMEEVNNIVDLYSEARIEETENGPLLMFDGNPVVTVADSLQAMGWNVKIKPAREEGADPFMHLPVKVNFNDRGPAIYLISGDAQNRLDEETVHRLDKIDILSVNLDIRPYDWRLNGKSGRAAYLQSMEVFQKFDRIAAKYER